MDVHGTAQSELTDEQAAAEYRKAAKNKAIVQAAIREVVIGKDPVAAERLYAENYIQHDPQVPDGRETFVQLLQSFPPNFKVEEGVTLAYGDFVLFYNRTTGFGPEPLIAAEIFRIENDKIVERWAVYQPDTDKTVSGHPLFTPDMAGSR
ncbi:nuclear transport factor 2 family protein [Kitasatospora sp. NPDC059599]|uniref:nuclear transport factor 2 family protein n=1 Tax=Kitasatospora sp. NPDC059599 TaxID=3346880 RepID=UPI0036B0EA27